MCNQKANLVLRIHKVLDLCLRELPHAQQPCSRRDLIAVGLPDLRGCKGQLAAIVVQEVPAQTHSTGWLYMLTCRYRATITLLTSVVEAACAARNAHKYKTPYCLPWHGSVKRELQEVRVLKKRT